jgi:hypothetical protein
VNNAINNSRHSSIHSDKEEGNEDNDHDNRMEEVEDDGGGKQPACNMAEKTRESPHSSNDKILELGLSRKRCNKKDNSPPAKTTGKKQRVTKWAGK